MDFSIIICTYNRSSLLQDLFESIAAQSFDVSKREILLIDNASTDDTNKISEHYSKIIPGFRYIFESEIGLSAARNRGWKESKGVYVGFLDDDAIAPQNWLVVAENIKNEVEPDAFGGRCYAKYITKKPRWYKDEYGSFFPKKPPCFLKEHEFLMGANMFILRNKLVLLGGFNNKFGMTGKKIAYGEETDFFIRLRERFPDTEIYFDPDLYVYHLVRPEKMTLSYCITYGIPNGIYSQRVFKHFRKPVIDTNNFAIKAKKSLVEVNNIILNLSQLLYIFTWGVLSRDKKEFPYFENYLYEKLLSLSIRFGSNIERLHELFTRIDRNNQ